MSGSTSGVPHSLPQQYRQQLDLERNLLQSGLSYEKEVQIKKAKDAIEMEALQNLKKAHMELQQIQEAKAQWYKHLATKDNYYGDMQPALQERRTAQAQYGAKLMELEAFLDAALDDVPMEYTWSQLSTKLAEIESIYKDLI